MRRVFGLLILGLWAAGCGASTHPGQLDVDGGCACSSAETCCHGKCVNPRNDPFNCGRCDVACQGGYFCSQGQCSYSCTRACLMGSTCCGNTCCGGGQLCCGHSGVRSSTPQCSAPVDGTCPQGL